MRIATISLICYEKIKVNVFFYLGIYLGNKFIEMTYVDKKNFEK